MNRDRINAAERRLGEAHAAALAKCPPEIALGLHDKVVEAILGYAGSSEGVDALGDVYAAHLQFLSEVNAACADGE